MSEASRWLYVGGTGTLMYFDDKIMTIRTKTNIILLRFLKCHYRFIEQNFKLHYMTPVEAAQMLTSVAQVPRPIYLPDTKQC